MKKAIFISAKMRGVPYYNFPAFDAARDRLEALGFAPLSPADMDRKAGFDPTNWCADAQLAAIASDWNQVPRGFDLAAAIARDNAAIDDPDTVATYVITEGFASSEGAVAEVERTMKAGKVIIFDTMSDEQILRALGVCPQKPHMCIAPRVHMSQAALIALHSPVYPSVASPITLADARKTCGEMLAKVIFSEEKQTFFKAPVTEPRAGAFGNLSPEQKTDLLAGKEIRVSDPVTGGHTSMRLARFDLLPQDILWEFAELYGRGAVKHGDSNMEAGYPWSWSFQKAMRHLSRFWQGEDVDQDTGCLHLLQAAWHCFTMAWFFRHNAGTDDRPSTKKENVP